MGYAGGQAQSAFVSFVPMIFLALVLGIVGHLLAKEKGRNVVLWTILGLIPIINLASVFYFVGAANLRIEKKIDTIIAELQRQLGVGKDSPNP